MKRSVGLLFSTAFVFLLVGVVCADDSNTKRDKSKSDSDSLVTEIAPGKRLYGQKPEFAEIGHALTFDLSHDGNKIAFPTSQGIRYWDIEDGKLDEIDKSEKGSQSNVGQHFEYSADGLKIFSSRMNYQRIEEKPSDGDAKPVTTHSQRYVVEVTSAVTGELLSTVEPVAGKKNSNRHLRFMIPAPDGDKVLLGFGQQNEIYDVETGELIQELKNSSWMQAAAFDNDGEKLIDGSGNIIDIETGEKDGKLPSLIFGNSFNSMKFHPRRNVIAASAWSSGVQLYDLDEKKKIDLDTPKAAKGQHMHLTEFSPDGELLACSTYANGQTGNSKPVIVIWDIDSGKIVNEIEFGGGHMARLRIDSDSKYIYAKAHGQFGLSRFEIKGKRKKSAPKLMNQIQRMQFVHDDEQILACPAQGEAVMFDLETGNPTTGIAGQNHTHLDMSESGQYVVLAANYQNIKIHNFKNDKSKNVQITSFKRPTIVSRLGSFLSRKTESVQYESYSIGSVTVSDDDKHLLVSLRGRQSFRWQKLQLKDGKTTDQKRFKFSEYWDTKDTNTRNEFNQFHWMPGSTTNSPNGELMAIVGAEKKILVLDTDSGDEEHQFEFENFNHGSSMMFFSRDSQRLFVKSHENLKTFDLDSGEETSDFKVGQGYQGVGLSRDRSKVVLMKSNPRGVVVYDLDTDEKLFDQKTKEHYVGLGISDDGRKLALGKSNSQFEVWDLDEVEKE